MFLLALGLTLITMDNWLLKENYAFDLETLIYSGT